LIKHGRTVPSTIGACSLLLSHAACCSCRASWPPHWRWPSPRRLRAPRRPPAAQGTEQKIERIRHEDAGARIDELRVGGETRSITVTPKGHAPAYEVAPESNNRNPAASDGQGEGRARWNILKY
jgi:hypothetical protein